MDNRPVKSIYNEAVVITPLRIAIKKYEEKFDERIPTAEIIEDEELLTKCVEYCIKKEFYMMN